MNPTLTILITTTAITITITTLSYTFKIDLKAGAAVVERPAAAEDDVAQPVDKSSYSNVIEGISSQPSL